MRSVVAALILIVHTGALAVPVACFGWETSAAARMACCRDEHPRQAATQTAADDCCARRHESRQPAFGDLVAASLSGSDAAVVPFSSQISILQGKTPSDP